MLLLFQPSRDERYEKICNFMTCWLACSYWCDGMEREQHALNLHIFFSKWFQLYQSRSSSISLSHETILPQNESEIFEVLKIAKRDHKEITFMLEFRTATAAAAPVRCDIFAHLFQPCQPTRHENLSSHMLRISKLSFSLFFSSLLLLVSLWWRHRAQILQELRLNFPNSPSPRAVKQQREKILTPPHIDTIHCSPKCSEADSLCFNSFFMINSIPVRYDEKMDSRPTRPSFLRTEQS